jgi:methionyl-tRNA synthetase
MIIPNFRTYYTHGKDNIPFHSIIFPALLMGLKNKYRLPDYIVSSAYVNLNDEKMSKSKGNLISVNELLENYDSDTLRFYFTFNGPELKDTSCSIEDLIQTHNKFLVGVLGNFINRNLSFVAKKFDNLITSGNIDNNIIINTQKTYQQLVESN